MHLERAFCKAYYNIYSKWTISLRNIKAGQFNWFKGFLFACPCLCICSCFASNSCEDPHHWISFEVAMPSLLQNVDTKLKLFEGRCFIQTMRFPKCHLQMVCTAIMQKTQILETFSVQHGQINLRNTLMLNDQQPLS